MADERSRYGLMVSALGAILLAISVFLPWYGVSFTAAGVAAAQQISQQVVSEFGNATLQSYTSGLHSSLAGLAGHEFTALSAHQSLKYLNVVLLVIAGLALLDVMLPLARPLPSIPDGAGGSAVLLGVVAAVGVLFRMVDRPVPVEGLLSLSLREGAWLALLGAITMVLGGMWPRVTSASAGPEASQEVPWSALSGWTPGDAT
jgi:hypothetical protein